MAIEGQAGDENGGISIDDQRGWERSELVVEN
jgi:hypothetical protein